MSVDRSGEQEPQFAAFVGIDWADQKHVWCLQAAGSQKRENGELEHSPEAVEVWVAQLCQRFAQGPIAVALEQSRGALVFMLSKYERLHLFPVPSTMAGNLRDALYPSGAKDDPRDADLLLDLLLKHRDKLRRLSLRDQEVIDEARRRAELAELDDVVSFEVGTLETFAPREVHGVVALHACDTATCDAIALGVSLGAD